MICLHFHNYLPLTAGCYVPVVVFEQAKAGKGEGTLDSRTLGGIKKTYFKQSITARFMFSQCNRVRIWRAILKNLKPVDVAFKQDGWAGDWADPSVLMLNFSSFLASCRHCCWIGGCSKLHVRGGTPHRTSNLNLNLNAFNVPSFSIIYSRILPFFDNEKS